MALLEPLVRRRLQPAAQRRVLGRGLIPGTGATPEASDDGRLWTAAMTPELAANLEGRATAPPLSPHAKAFMLRAWDARIGARHGEEQ